MAQNLESGLAAGGTGKSAAGALVRETAPGTGQAGSNVKEGGIMAGGLLTDLYELNMAASYLRRGMTGLATFSLFVRQLPADRGFLVAAGSTDLARLPPAARALRGPAPVPVHVSEQLQGLQDQLTHDLGR